MPLNWNFPAKNGPKTGWQVTQLGDIQVFDDQFVVENVHSGLAIGADQRKNLHELILGAQGVSLGAAVQAHAARIEEHNRELRQRADRIPGAVRGSLDVDSFCLLTPVEDIENLIRGAEQALAAARSADAVQERAKFIPLQLPGFDLAAIDQLMQSTLSTLETEALHQVQTHLATLGAGGEQWVSEGISKIEGASVDRATEICPFCAQDLQGSCLLQHYRLYFSAAYESLTNEINDQIASVERLHAGDILAAFERSVRVLSENRDFWRAFVIVPEDTVDTAAIVRQWISTRDAVLATLRQKQANPLSLVPTSADTRRMLEEFRALRERALNISNVF